ncbi:uncharacterized protein ACIQIH_010119 [Cyanocitta cristata]
MVFRLDPQNLESGRLQCRSIPSSRLLQCWQSLLECWPGFGRSQVAWSSEVFPVRNPCWGCFPWLSQGEGTALEFLQPQAGDASPENQFRIIHLTLSLTCGFQGAFWSSGYSQERIFQHLTFKPGIANPHLSAGKLVKG